MRSLIWSCSCGKTKDLVARKRLILLKIQSIGPDPKVCKKGMQTVGLNKRPSLLLSKLLLFVFKNLMGTNADMDDCGV